MPLRKLQADFSEGFLFIFVFEVPFDVHPKLSAFLVCPVPQRVFLYMLLHIMDYSCLFSALANLGVGGGDRVSCIVLVQPAF